MCLFISIYLPMRFFSLTVVKCMLTLFHKHPFNVFYCSGIVLSLREVYYNLHEKTGFQRLGNLAKVTQLLNNGARIWT